MPSYEFHLLGLSQWLQNALGVSSVIADYLAFGIVLMVCLIPCFLMKVNNYVMSVIIILLMGAFTAIGFLPIYTWVFLSLYLAITISGKMKGWF